MSLSVAPEAVGLSSSPGLRLERRHLKTLGIVLGLALIVASNYILRHNLEGTRLPAYPIFPGNKVPWSWQLLLPNDIGAAENAVHKAGSYHWFTTGLTV